MDIQTPLFILVSGPIFKAANSLPKKCIPTVYSKASGVHLTSIVRSNKEPPPEATSCLYISSPLNPLQVFFFPPGFIPNAIPVTGQTRDKLMSKEDIYYHFTNTRPPHSAINSPTLWPPLAGRCCRTQ